MKNGLFTLYIAVFFLFASCGEQNPTEGVVNTDTIQSTPVINTLPDSAPEKNTNAKVKSIYRCGGNEPFWSLTVDNNSIRFFEQALEKEWEYSTEIHSVKGINYNFISSSGASKIYIDIKKEPCEDYMSGEPFEYSVLIKKDGDHFKGCCKCIEK